MNLEVSYLHHILNFSYQVWREATIPLYHCRCRICERATRVQNAANGMAAAPVTAAAENTNTSPTAVPPAVTESPPVTQSQPVEIHHERFPQVEVEDVAEQEPEEEDYLTSASVTESTTTTDAVPSHVRKRALDEVDGDEGLEYADDAYGSEDAASSNGADDYGDAVYLHDTAPPYEKHTTITPPIANVQLSVPTGAQTTVVNLTPTKKRRTSGTYSPARARKRSSEELEADDVEYESPCEQRKASAVTTKRVRTSPEPEDGEKPPAVILKVPPHLS